MYIDGKTGFLVRVSRSEVETEQPEWPVLPELRLLPPAVLPLPPPLPLLPPGDMGWSVMGLVATLEAPTDDA